jgi:RNA recognition motif-containing protein
MTDRETGQPRGFAFVEMADDAAAEMAIAALNGTELKGRAVHVNPARPQLYRNSGKEGSRAKKDATVVVPAEMQVGEMRQGQS